ncbi:MAG: cytidylate kinase [Bdellovibrionaceae bacterium]|nr:cytidylate kinase [Pseudobdellovibrionaceae bacterium]|tara:strand:+ start:1288 stop:2004 length:717 start_codon:yes stop_codon:yes gene_type:complete
MQWDDFPKKGKVIAIDGPAGTGKSSIARTLSEDLKWNHIDTGALYRSIAYLCLEQGIDLGTLGDSEFSKESQNKIIELAKKADFQFVRKENLNPSLRVFVNEIDVTNEIRSSQVSAGASRVSSLPEVRQALLEVQRKLGCKGNSLLEGRDIGTVIFPDADYKFYLTASSRVRAQRRLKDLQEQGESPSLEDLQQQIEQRDEADMNRSTAPLKKAADAIEIDTTDLSFEQVIEKMKSYL